MLLSLMALASAAFVQAGCPVERAHYRLRREPEVAAWFRRVKSSRDWPSGLALAIQFRKSTSASDPRSGRIYWWVPWNGGSDGRQNLASTTDVTVSGWRPPNPDDGPRPYGNMEVIFADRDYDLWGHVPVAGETAPAHILLPSLRDLGHVGGGVMDATEKQFFDLVKCDRRPR